VALSSLPEKDRLKPILCPETLSPAGRCAAIAAPPPASIPSPMARILVIDDDDDLREMIVAALRFAGHLVAQASSGREGTRLFHSEPTDLVITDIVMPGQDGIETLMALRKEYQRLPIIAMSGLSRDSPLYLQIAARLGARRTLAKPFPLEELLRLTNEVLTEEFAEPPAGDEPR